MANKIILKKTSTASKVPLSTDLEVGEIAVNLADQKLYSKNAGGTVVLVGNGQATGTVTSVGITPSTGVTVSGSPVTTSGNITVGLSTKLTAIENLSGAGFITQNGSGAIAGRTIQAGTGISVAHGNGSSQDPVITNSAPDQVVSLTGAGATTITGTYPSFTVSSVNTTYSQATSTTLGLIELGSDTVQTVAPNAVSATASRSYALQLNSAGQAMVNVPWTDTNSGGTVTSITGGTYLTGGTITTSGTLAVDATSANTASKVVARDASGNFSAGTITASLSGNATSATTATTATNATNVAVTTSATASAFKVPFANTTASTTGNYGLLQDSTATFTYNPSTNVLTVGTVSGALSGNATTATTLATGRTVAITGDLTYTSGSFNGSANVTGTGTLATVNSNVGTYGSSTAIPVVTVNAKGLVTAVSTATVAGGQYFGTATTKAIAYNANSISENITVTAGNNGLSASPITINTGYTVTVATGANWVIV
jgi:hypothetical protein